MKNLLLMTVTSVLSFGAAFASVYGLVTFNEFMLLTVPMLAYSVWLGVNPEASIEVVIGFPRAYFSILFIFGIGSAWYLYKCISTSQYETLIYFGLVSIPLAFVSGYFAIKQARQYGL